MGHMRSMALAMGFASWIAVTTSGCAFVFTSGAPDTPVTAANAAEIVADPPCTQGTAWAWVDVVFVGAYGGVATASTMEAIEIGLAEAIGLAVGTVAHAVSAIIGFGRSGSCSAYMTSARATAAAPPGTTPAVAGPITPTTPGFTATFTMQQVQALQRGVQTSEQLRQQFGEPQSRIPINPPSPDGCVEVWTWMRGMSALSVAFGPDGTVCKVATAGPPPQ
jgi:hypothetical protein